MTELEKKKLQVELYKVRAARLETEVRIFERQEEIKKIEENLALQTQREKELETKLEEN